MRTNCPLRRPLARRVKLVTRTKWQNLPFESIAPSPCLCPKRRKSGPCESGTRSDAPPQAERLQRLSLGRLLAAYRRAIGVSVEAIRSVGVRCRANRGGWCARLGLRERADGLTSSFPRDWAAIGTASMPA